MVENALCWLHECCMGFVLGGMLEHERLFRFIFWKVAAAVDEWQLVCEGAAGRVQPELRANGYFDVFRLFLHIAVTCCFGMFDSKTQVR